MTDFHALDRGHDVVITGAADHCAFAFAIVRCDIDDGECKTRALVAHLECGLNPAACFVRLGHAREAKVPQFTVGSRFVQTRLMRKREWFETNAVAFERNVCGPRF